MRRTFIFAAMTICLVWWQQLVPATASARPEPALLEDNETSPYWTCNGNVCEQRDECGVSNCPADSDCAGSTCPPGAELECLASGGAWHPDCTCDPPPCDPGGMATCAYEWGTWDPLTCMCSNPCNAGPPQLYLSNQAAAPRPQRTTAFLALRPSSTATCGPRWSSIARTAASGTGIRRTWDGGRSSGAKSNAGGMTLNVGRRVAAGRRGQCDLPVEQTT